MSLRGTVVNKIVPVREIEAAAPRLLLPLEQEAEDIRTYTIQCLSMCRG